MSSTEKFPVTQLDRTEEMAQWSEYAKAALAGTLANSLSCPLSDRVKSAIEAADIMLSAHMSRIRDKP